MSKKISTQKLRIICEEFRKGMLGRGSSRGQCAKLSWALQGFLSFTGLNTRVFQSHVGDWNHMYLIDEYERVIDCTPDQFDKKYPKVYIGKGLKIHKRGEPWKINYRA